MDKDIKRRKVFAAWLFGTLFAIFTIATVVFGLLGEIVGYFTGSVAIVMMFCLISAFFSENVKGFIDQM